MKILPLLVLLLGIMVAWAQDRAKAKLEKSPCAGEWSEVTGASSHKVNTFIVSPKVCKKAAAVLSIHEILGLSDWTGSAGLLKEI
ncbi:MAG: hypothetical protein ABIP97_01160 [Chthoniobacterales bacterium]